MTTGTLTTSLETRKSNALLPAIVYVDDEAISPDAIDVDPERSVIAEQSTVPGKGEGVYLRPRPPSMVGSGLRNPVLRVGRIFWNLNRRTHRFEIWLLDLNTGEQRILGECELVSYVTERDGVEGEHHFLDWQKMLGVPVTVLIPTVSAARNKAAFPCGTVRTASNTLKGNDTIKGNLP